MDDFSSELFSSFFDDHLLERPLLADRPSLLHMDIDSSPGQLLFNYDCKNMHPTFLSAPHTIKIKEHTVRTVQNSKCIRG